MELKLLNKIRDDLNNTGMEYVDSDYRLCNIGLVPSVIEIIVSSDKELKGIFSDDELMIISVRVMRDVDHNGIHHIPIRDVYNALKKIIQEIDEGKPIETYK